MNDKEALKQFETDWLGALKGVPFPFCGMIEVDPVTWKPAMFHSRRHTDPEKAAADLIGQIKAFVHGQKPDRIAWRVTPEMAVCANPETLEREWTAYARCMFLPRKE